VGNKRSDAASSQTNCESIPNHSPRRR
jgi:hypothetical protein